MESSIIELLSIKKSNNLKIEEISKLLGVEIEDVLDTINRMEEEGIIYRNKSDKYMLVANTTLKKGIIKVTKRKGPIVVLEDRELILEFNSHNKVMNNDIVLVDPYNKSGKAQLVKILESNYKDYVGEVVKEGKYYKAISQGKDDIILKKIYPIGTKVLIDGKTNQIKEVIGHKDDVSIKVKEVLMEHGFPIKFSLEYENELENIPSFLPEEEINSEIRNGRYDLRNIDLVTIDGDDTKDFDDAVCFQDGLLYVSIEDTSYHVKEDSVIDKETISRGISVYPPDMVNPMIHHKLSNGICSLIPGEDRFAVTLILKLDNNGKVLSCKLCDSVIQSKMRMTYSDVNLFLEDGIVISEYSKYIDMLNNLYDIASKVKKKMLNEGFLEFTDTEVKFIMENSKVKDIKKRYHGKAEDLIEFLMLLNNMVMTDYFIKNKLPFIARNHERPNDVKISNWNNLLKQRGYNIHQKKKYTSEDIKNSLSSYEGSREQVVLDDIAIKSQSKAKYEAYNKGHFALGLKAYATFTSPIRRLADYINQRIYKDAKYYGNKYAINKWESRMEYLAKIATDSERRADKVEKIMDDIKKAEYMSSFIGSKYTGIVAEVGIGYIKVLLPNMVYGIVQVSSYEYELSRDGFSLSSNNTTEKILVGDYINVSIGKVDIDDGKIILLREDKKYKECSNDKEKKKNKKKIKSR